MAILPEAGQTFYLEYSAQHTDNVKWVLLQYVESCRKECMRIS